MRGSLSGGAVSEYHGKGGSVLRQMKDGSPLGDEGTIMSNRDRLGGIIHTYQKYDPTEFPSPTAPPPDLVSPPFEHLLPYGSMRRLTTHNPTPPSHLHPTQLPA